MKRSSLIALLITAPLALMAQVTIFNDNFTNGSTLNSASPSGPSTNAASYELISSKSWSPAPSITNKLKFGIASTSSGVAEVQALFAATPVVLSAIGSDYLQLTVVFTNVSGILATNAMLGVGLYNSGQVQPVAGGLNGTATTSSSTAATGGAVNWQGYVGQVTSISTNSSRIMTRAAQNAGSPNYNNAQDVIASGSASSTYTNPPAATVGTNTPGAFNLTAGGQYTEVLVIALNAANSLAITNLLYAGASAGGTPLMEVDGVATNATYLTNSFDSLAVGWRTVVTGPSNTIVISSINVVGPASALQVPPTITAQPVAVNVATNGSCAFAVSASGSGLTYQWHRNGTTIVNGGNISGATGHTLVIDPAGPGDVFSGANGYYVIVSGNTSSTNSITNSLALVTGTNLTWSSAGNVWDVNTTANWIDPQSNTRTFAFGAPVTFDDTTGDGNLNVTLADSHLSSTLVTVNSSANYSFAGNGNIFGVNSALRMIGSGTLTISNANNYGGGTTISSGNLITKSQQALGSSGNVTLSGGQLEIGLASGAATAGLSNINVTASSTLQLDGAGTYTFVLQNQLTGSPGATLTIQQLLNNGSGTCRVRLYGAFTNNAPLVISGAMGGNGMDVAPYHASGNQVYNGLISGTGGRLVPRGGGNVILNAANTFNDSSVQANGSGPSGYSVFMSSGNVGVGADSALPASSPLGTGNLGINVGSEGGNCSLFASGGNHTVGNPVIYTSATNTVTLTISGSNDLTLSGPFNLSGADGTGGTNRTLQVNNTGLTTLSGIIGDAGLGCGLIKTGTGILAVNDSDTYTGPTIVSNGMLEGIGTITSAVTIETNGTLGAGTTAIGKFTINSNLTLLGNLFIKVNRSVSPSNDVIAVSGTLANTGTGTVTVTNLGATTLVVGDKFKLFNQAVAGGGTLTVAGGGATWNNNLATDGSIQVLSLISPIASYSTNISFTVSGGGNTLTVSWPATHLGWELMVQTNSLTTGLGNNWVTNTGTASVTTTNFPINPANGAVFYRLVHP